MRSSYVLISLSLLSGFCARGQQILTCNSTAVPPIIRGEGITERVGDIVLNCAGGPSNAKITGNFSVFLPTNITNRTVAGTVTGINFTADNGSGPQPITAPGTLAGPGNLVYNGLTFTLSPTGAAVLRLANLRTAAAQLMLTPNASIQAYLSFNSTSLVTLTNSNLIVGTIARSLYAGNSSKLVCAPGGSPLPSTLSFSNLIASGATFASTRVTEGFADALGPRSAWANLNADTAERIVVRFSGFPAGARLLAPDVVAGSDAVQPTAGGDFGFAASGGQYAPSANGSLLLARVRNSDVNGAGGSVAYVPGAPGSPVVSFDSVSEVPLTNGSGYLVYEVVDANANVLESAQFPVFLGLAPSTVNTPVVTGADVTLAPVSLVFNATATDPIPRFQSYVAPDDCKIIGDCGATYFASMYVNTAPLVYTASAATGNQPGYVQVRNEGGGVLRWNATVAYQNGSGWLSVNPSSGINNGTIRVDAVPGSLPIGVYQATLTVDGGPAAGTKTVPVTFTVTAVPPPAIAPPAIRSVVNAASFAAGPVAPGSLATIQGVQFAGKNVAVTFDGLPAVVLFSNSQQINVLIPNALASKQSAQLVVTVDGNASAAMKVSLTDAAPAIFSGAVVNQDNSVNGPANPAAPGSVLQIYATGFSGSGVTAQIGDRTITTPYYAGPAPGLVGVQQVDLMIPQDLPAGSTTVSLCVGTVCSPAAPVVVSAAGVTPQ